MKKKIIVSVLILISIWVSILRLIGFIFELGTINPSFITGKKIFLFIIPDFLSVVCCFLAVWLIYEQFFIKKKAHH